MIKAGSGASVTGTGRPDNPYVVSTDGGGGGGASGFDSGDLKWSARTSAPTGWLVADGAAVSRASYPDLFDAIGILYGAGDGSTTFNLPDFTGRFMLGADGGHAPGSTGGAETRTLSEAQMPAHTHPIGAVGNHEHVNFHSNDDTGVLTTTARTAGTSGRVKDGNMIDGAGAHTHTIESTGGGQPFSMMPPYGTALPLIKT